MVSNAWNVGAKDLEFTENGKNNFILFFMLYLVKRIVRVLKRIGRIMLFLEKNNKEWWMESEVYLEAIRTFTMELFS